MKTESMTQLDQEELRLAIARADAILGNRIAFPLRDMRILPFPARLEEISIENSVWLFKLDRLAVKQDTRIEEKLTNIMKAIHLSGASLMMMLRCLEGQCSFYLGVVNKQSHKSELIAMKRILESGMKGNFPGTRMTEMTLCAVRNEIDNVFSNRFETQCITSVTGAASGRGHDAGEKPSLRGIENMVDSLGDATFTLLVIADPISSDYLREIRTGYESLGTQLSPFQKSSFSSQKGGSVNISHNTSESVSASLSKSVSMTQSYTQSDGWSKSVFEAGHRHTGQKIGQTVGIVASSAADMVIPHLGRPVELLTDTIFGGKETGSESRGISDTSGSSEQSGISRQEGSTVGSASSESRTVTLNYENYTIRGLLERIQETLKLLNDASVYGAYQCAAYVLSSNASTNLLVASQYHSLMCGNGTALQMTDINTWTEAAAVKEIKKYLHHLSHPMFESSVYEHFLTPAVMVGSTDLAYHIALPHKSIKGLTVTEMRSFGRSVRGFERQRDDRNTIQLGNIFYMGDVDSQPVSLDLQSLSMHTFITGATGSGKSNTVYQILRELHRQGISYLVVEPAKGEYKNVFGNFTDVSVYGTNPRFTDLLRINPFKFPKGIHVLEHVDRLIEIFNVCWPMYAAMPAVLKEAVLQAYEACGWDLKKSENELGCEIFPTFRDLLAQLEEVINRSSYDHEVKSNYKGSLETRIRSLTNGLNGQIFCAGENDNRLLFDRNAIVDLSRIGSTETKSLIMGILIMRVNERRMSNAKGMNVPLWHVTVLEEAHNILKRATGGGGPEGSDITGKSVEMLSNAIAEIRTYGEGFLIADQSPGAVDSSAIRNTNTKIIMRLPDEGDRRLSGKSAALKDEQLDEIAKLPRGVAVVYQNNWLEPVLCKIRKFPGREIPYEFTPSNSERDQWNTWLLSELLAFLLRERMRETAAINLEQIERLLPDADFSSALKLRLRRLIQEYKKHSKLSLWEKGHLQELSQLTAGLLDIQKQVERAFREAGSAEYFNDSLFRLIEERVGTHSSEFATAIAQCLMANLCAGKQNYQPRYEAWLKSVLLKGGRIIS